MQSVEDLDLTHIRKIYGKLHDSAHSLSKVLGAAVNRHSNTRWDSSFTMLHSLTKLRQEFL